FFRLLHQPQGFAVTFRVRGSEVAKRPFLGSMALLNGNHRNRHPIEPGNSTHNGRIVPEPPVAVKFHKSLEDMLYVVKARRSCVIPGQFYTGIGYLTHWTNLPDAC